MENITVTEESPARRAAVAGLAVVGFFALVFIGMVLAIYAARFVPKTASGLSSAAAFLSSVFTPAGTPTLTTVPTTVAFPAATSTALVATTTATSTDASAATTPAATPTYVAPHAGQQTTTAQVINGATGTVYSGTPYGLPNLVATVTAVGYLDNNGNFVQGTTINNTEALAVKFTVSNTGTNIASGWALSAVLPTKANSNYTYNSNNQQALNPGDHIDFTLHLDAGQAEIGSNEQIKVTADNNNQVTESNENDNVSYGAVTVTN